VSLGTCGGCQGLSGFYRLGRWGGFGRSVTFGRFWGDCVVIVLGQWGNFVVWFFFAGKGGAWFLGGRYG